MRLFRSIPAIMLALAMAVGGTGYAPIAPMADAGMADSGGTAAADQAMPDCPMCAPDDPLGPSCAPGCPVPAAILPLAALMPVVPAVSRQIRSTAHRLADTAGTPEPPPPKPTLLV